jgi:hypothetical protein
MPGRGLCSGRFERFAACKRIGRISVTLDGQIVLATGSS